MCGTVRPAGADCFIRCGLFEFLPSCWNVCARTRLPDGTRSEANDAEEITVVVGPKRRVDIVVERSTHGSDEGILETCGVGRQQYPVGLPGECARLRVVDAGAQQVELMGKTGNDRGEIK